MSEKCCCCWISSPGCSPTPADAGLPSTVKIGGDRVEVRFARHPAIAALARGKKWRITPEFINDQMLEGRVRDGRGEFRLVGAGTKYEIDIPEPDSDAIAFLPPEDKTGAIPVAIVGAIDGKTQIKVDRGGNFSASPNLDGKTVKLRTKVIFKQATEQLPEDIEACDFHAIFKRESGKIIVWQYLRWRDAKAEYLGNGKVAIASWTGKVEEYL